MGMIEKINKLTGT